MKKGKAVLTAVLVSVLVFSASCSADDTELRRRLIIEGIGVDMDSDGYVLTVQTLNTAQSQSTDSPASDEAVSVYTVKGASISAALSQLRAVSGKNPLYSQNRIIIVGSSAENSFCEAMDFFVREYASRISVTAAVSEGNASDILNSQSEPGTIGAKSVQEIIELGGTYSHSFNSEIYSLMNAFSDKNAGVCIPLLKTEKDILNGEETAVLNGARVFKNGRAQCSLTPEEVSLLLLSKGKSGKCIFSFDDSDGICVSVEILKSKTKVKTGRKPLPEPEPEIEISLSAGILEYASGDPDGLTGEKLAEINTLLTEKIETDMSALFEKMLMREKTDIFGFSGRYSLFQSKKYYEFEDEWDNIISKIKPKITVGVDLKRIGVNSARFG